MNCRRRNQVMFDVPTTAGYLKMGRLTELQAVIFDWAGTTVDYGSRCPAQVFVEIFRRRGVEITEAEARGPMGRAKHVHIALVAALPRVAELWQRQHGCPVSESDILGMYHDFLPLQKQILAAGSSVIPGVPEVIDWLRRNGLRIGSSTGYTRELMDVVCPLAESQGFVPDVTVCSDEVPAGRPAPWLNLRVAEQLQVFPLHQIAIVDDTLVGIEAGRNAGMLTIAVSQTGNLLGLSAEEVADLPPDVLQQHLKEIEKQFLSIGADYVIRSVTELPALLISEGFHTHVRR